MDTEFFINLGCKYPIIGAPMFLVSNQDIVTEVSLAGGLGSFPSLNCRTTDELDQWLGAIKTKVGDLPYGVNLILHESNERLEKDKEVLFDHKVPLIICSLGNPQELIKEARPLGIKVVCDVINLKHAKKAVDVGADGLIVVSSGAGGHAGTLSPFASLPWFKKNFPKTPLIAAGGISTGENLLASLALGASGVSIGTRFIASKESKASKGYKRAVIEATPEDIFMSKSLSGVNASIIRAKGTEEFYQWDHSLKGKVTQFINYKFRNQGLKIKKKYSWNNVWSAGQSVGGVEAELSCKEIMEDLVSEYNKTLGQLNKI